MIQIKQIHRFTGHSGAIYCLSEAEGESLILSGSSDQFVAGWNLKTLQPDKFAIKLQATIYRILYVPERNLLLIGNANGEIHCIDLESKQEIKNLKVFNSGVFDLKYQDNQFFAASAEGLIAFGNLDTLEIEKLVKVSDSKVRQLDVSPINNLLAAACGDGFVRIFDVQKRVLIQEFLAHNLSANAVKFKKNGKLLTGGRDAYLKQWDTSNNFSLEKSIPAHNYAIYSIALQTNGNLIATASRDKTVKIWDENLNVLYRLDKAGFDGHLNSANTLLWHKPTGYLISASDDRSIIVWEVTAK